jgi:hypothetical protein
VTNEPTHLYRYDYQFLNISDGVFLHLQCRQLLIKKITPKGYKVKKEYDSERFILKNAKKKFAYETKDAAFESFVARKKRQREILQYQLALVEAALKLTPEEPKVPIDEGFFGE